MQLSEGFDFTKRITGAGATLFTPKSRNWAGSTVQYSALIESLQIRISQPSLGAPGPLPEGLEDLGNLGSGEAYRGWQWAQPRRHLEILKGGIPLMPIAILNREPFYIMDLMPFLSQQSTARIGFGTSLEIRIVDAGFGPLAAQDTIVVWGEGVQEADVEDLAPQFSALEDALIGQMRTYHNALSARLEDLEAWATEQSPKIEALRNQGASNALELAQVTTDLDWIRRNWGEGGGGGGTGGGEQVAPLTSTAGAVSPSIAGAGKFRTLPPGTYKVRISIAPDLLAQVPESSGAKTIELVSWSQEPNDQVIQYMDEVNQYNWNSPNIVRWEKDLPRTGGEVTITATAERRWWGVKVRNSAKPNYWGGPHSHYLDGVFVAEQALAGYSAEWVAKGF